MEMSRVLTTKVPFLWPLLDRPRKRDFSSRMSETFYLIDSIDRVDFILGHQQVGPNKLIVQLNAEGVQSMQQWYEERRKFGLQIGVGPTAQVWELMVTGVHPINDQRGSAILEGNLIEGTANV